MGLELLLVRHAETAWSRSRRIQGQTDIPLSPLGVSQAERLAERLKGYALAAIYASDLQRSWRTAEVIAAGHRVELRLRPRLRECAFGELEGLTFEEVERRYPAIARAWLERSMDLAYPGGESLRAVRGRSLAFFRQLQRDHPAGAVLVVGHDGPLRWGLGYLLGWRMERWWEYHLEPASLTVVETSSDNPRLVLFNDTSHLAGLAGG